MQNIIMNIDIGLFVFLELTLCVLFINMSATYDFQKLNITQKTSGKPYRLAKCVKVQMAIVGDDVKKQ